MKNEISAIIVARSGSVRVPGKNMLKLGDETLLSRKIKQLKSCKLIDRVILGSDSDQMLRHAAQFGAETVKRQAFFCDEKVASANDMIREMMDLIHTDIVLWAHCTNPLVSAFTYDRAIQTFLDNYPAYDSLLSVVELKEHLWGTDKKPLNYNPYAPKHTCARDLPPYYMQDGAIFIQPYEQMKKNAYFFGKTPFLFSIPPEEFLDINTQRDYLLARALTEK